MLNDMSGVQVSTAAENVCLLQTHATVGSPEIDVSGYEATKDGYPQSGLTGKYVFVDPCELDIRLGRIGDD